MLPSHISYTLFTHKMLHCLYLQQNLCTSIQLLVFSNGHADTEMMQSDAYVNEHQRIIIMQEKIALRSCCVSILCNHSPVQYCRVLLVLLQNAC